MLEYTRISFSQSSICKVCANNCSMYESESVCNYRLTQSTGHIESNPPLEIRGLFYLSSFSGLSQKLDNGEVSTWGFKYLNYLYTDWAVLGGPITGFHYKKNTNNIGMSEFGFVVGDECSPKYLTARKLNLNLGEKRTF